MSLKFLTSVDQFKTLFPNFPRNFYWNFFFPGRFNFGQMDFSPFLKPCRATRYTTISQTSFQKCVQTQDWRVGGWKFNLDKIKSAREEELSEEIPSEIWGQSLELIHRCSSKARHCLIQFKVLHRHKCKLNKIFPEVCPLRDKCNFFRF